MSAGSQHQSTPRELRRHFLVELVRQTRVIWPILSGIFVLMAGCGIVIGRLENWRFGESLYFTFVTGLTIGYGDLTPKTLVGRLLAMVVGFAGIVVTGLVAAISVQALRATTRD